MQTVGRMLGILFFALFIFVGVAFGKELVPVTDMAGRKVYVPRKVERIVALHGSLRYVVYLQAFEKVVGVEEVEKRGTMRGGPSVGKAYWNVIKERVKGLPSIGEGGPGKLPDFERLLEVRPELVLTFEKELADLIQEKTGIPVFVLDYAGPGRIDLDKVRELIALLGKVLGKEKRASELNAYLKELIKELEQRTQGIGSGPKVYVGGVSMRGHQNFFSTEADFPPFKWLKAKNVVDEAGKKGHLFIDRESLLKWDPDFIFIDVNGLPLIKEDYLKNPSFYQHLKAVRNGRVYTIFPVNFYRTNLEILFANAFFMGKVLYPERFKELSPEKKAREIFVKFLGKDIFDDLKGVYPGYEKLEFRGSEIIFKQILF